jgi:hypothetical protein
MKKMTVRLDWLPKRYELIRYSNATAELKIMLFLCNRYGLNLHFVMTLKSAFLKIIPVMTFRSEMVFEDCRT